MLLPNLDAASQGSFIRSGGHLLFKVKASWKVFFFGGEEIYLLIDFIIGNSVREWLALPPHSKKAAGSITGLGSLQVL